MAKNKSSGDNLERQKRIDNAIRLSQEAGRRNQVYQQNVAARTGQPAPAGTPNQSVMQRQQAQQYQQMAEQQQRREDPYGNRAREPHSNFLTGKSPYTETQGIYSPQTVESLNTIRPPITNNLLQALQMQNRQPSFLDQLQESDAYAPYMYDNLLGDPESNIGMGGDYSNSNLLGPLAHAFIGQNITPHIPGLLQQLSEYLTGNKGQPAAVTQNIPQMDPENAMNQQLNQNTQAYYDRNPQRSYNYNDRDMGYDTGNSYARDNNDVERPF